MARLNKTWKAAVDDAAIAAELHQVLEISHRQAKGLLDASCVSVNGDPITKYGKRIKLGDTITVTYDDTTIYKELPKPKRSAGGEFTVLLEDRHLLFVNKAAGLLTVPAEKGGEANLADAITDHYRRRGFKRFNLFIVHRLDRFTSGVLVFGKTPEALHGLKAMFEDHKLNRVYKAILVGELPENSGTMTGHLVEHSKSLRMSVDKRDTKGAKQAITHYRVMERLPGHTVVEVKLETGRRNQIRVQFADKGFPLLGDHVYGSESELIDRQALHAELLGFRHPVDEQNVTVTAPLPADMEAALKALRTASRVQRAEAGVQGEEGIFKPKITKGRKLDRIDRAKLHTKEEKAPRPRPYEDRPRFERPSEARPREEREDRKERPSPPTSPRPTPAQRAPRPERESRPSTFGGPSRTAKIEHPNPDEGPVRSRYSGPRRAEGTGPSAKENRPSSGTDTPTGKSSDRPTTRPSKRDEAPARSRYAGPRDDRPAEPRKPRTDGPSGDDRTRPKRGEDRPAGDERSRPTRGGTGDSKGKPAKRPGPGTKVQFRKAPSGKSPFHKVSTKKKTRG